LAHAEKELEEAEIPAFSEEIIACDNLLSYFANHHPDSVKGVLYEKTAQKANGSFSSIIEVRQPDSSNVPNGVALTKKADREEDYFVGGKYAKKGSKSSKKSKDSAAASLRLPLVAIKLFRDLELEVPTNAQEITKAVAEIKVKKVQLLSSQEQATKDNQARVEAKIKALMDPSAVASIVASGRGGGGSKKTTKKGPARIDGAVVDEETTTTTFPTTITISAVVEVEATADEVVKESEDSTSAVPEEVEGTA